MGVYKNVAIFGTVLLINACSLAQSSQPYPYQAPAIVPPSAKSPYPYPGQNPLLTEYALSPTHTPTSTSLPERIEIHFYKLELLWRECELPRPNNESQEECLGVTMSKRTESESSPFGETFTPPGGLSRGFRLTIGNDVYESVHQPSPEGGYSDANGMYEYHLFKNGQLLLTMITTFSAYDPNVSLLNINGKYAWEFANPKQPTIIYDGVDLRQEFDLEAAYRPYVVGETMIFVARKNGNMFVVADGEQIGPGFDQIYNGYCCETKTIIRSPGQYWFWATREGRRFVVAITEIK